MFWNNLIHARLLTSKSRERWKILWLWVTWLRPPFINSNILNSNQSQIHYHFLYISKIISNLLVLGTSKLSIKMTQAFVQKRKNLERTISTIQIPKTKNSIDEEEVKRVLTSQAKAFFDTDSNLLKEKSEKSYKLASLLNKALISLPCLAQHKVVVYVWKLCIIMALHCTLNYIAENKHNRTIKPSSSYECILKYKCTVLCKI